MPDITLELPWPPSVNTYWRHITLKGKPRVLISKKGREYRKAAITAVQAQRPAAPQTGRLSVQLVAHPPDRRKRDLDNLPKAVLDSLTHAGLWEDDSQIDRLEIRRAPVIKAGRVHVTVEAIEEPALCA